MTALPPLLSHAESEGSLLTDKTEKMKLAVAKTEAQTTNRNDRKNLVKESRINHRKEKKHTKARTQIWFILSRQLFNKLRFTQILKRMERASKPKRRDFQP